MVALDAGVTEIQARTALFLRAIFQDGDCVVVSTNGQLRIRTKESRDFEGEGGNAQMLKRLS
jgi:hypothetical protein